MLNSSIMNIVEHKKERIKRDWLDIEQELISQGYTDGEFLKDVYCEHIVEQIKKDGMFAVFV